MTKTETLCHMAWDYPMFFMFTNSIGYCCRTPRLAIDQDLLESMGEDFWSNHPQFVKRRQELVKGIKSEDCSTCWKLEDAGFKSSRSDKFIEHSMRRNDPKFPLNLPTKHYQMWPGIERSNHSNCIEIVLNNTCDAKCTYCSEFYSTQWLTEKKKYGEVSRSYSSQEHRNPRAEEIFWSWYENRAMRTNRRFGFIGGEPLIIDAQYECFDKLLEIHGRNEHLESDRSEKMELCITSNLNTPPAYFKKFLEYVPRLEKYFHIIIQVSGENTGRDLEYVRHGVKWARWSSNIEHLLQHTNIELSFLPCLNLLSIPRFHEYLEYFQTLSEKYGYMRIHQNIVTHPIEQSPMMAPREFAKYFDSCIEIIKKIIEDYDNDTRDKNQFVRNSYTGFLEWLETTQSAVIQNPSETEPNFNSVKFYRFFKKLDERRRTNVLEVFPEVEPFYRTGELSSGAIIDPKIIPIQKIQ